MGTGLNIITVMAKIDQFKLTNDLPVILVDMPEVPSAAIGFMTKVGQRDGGLNKAEISHVLEHLIFDGTEKLPGKSAVTVAIDEIGAEFAGETYEEFTNYYLKSEPKSFERAIFILSQILVHPLLGEAELEKEKQVIFQELNLREDEPITKIMDFLQETLFPDHPLGCSREYSKKSLPRLSREDLFSHWRKNYLSGNSVITVCADLRKIGGIKNWLENYFGNLSKGERELLEKVGEEELGRVQVINKKTSQVHFALGKRSYPIGDKRVYSSKLLDIVFGHAFSSRLFQEIREKRKLAYALFSSIDFYQDTGVFSVYEGVDQKKLPEAIEATRGEMEKITKDGMEGIKEEELLKAKNYLSGRFAIQTDDPAAQVFYYGKRFLFEKEIVTPEDLTQRYLKVNREELVEVARDLFRPEKLNLVAMGEEIKKDKLEELIR